MAIQFNCPYCTASIRVPDSAAGKRGTCPKCGTKLVVPLVQPPSASAPPLPEKPAAPEASSASQSPVSPPAPIPPVIPTDSIAGESPSMAQLVRRRKKRKRTNLIIPLLMFGVVVGVLVYWMWTPAAKLEGEITADRLSDFAIPPALVEKSSFPLPSEEIDPIWESLRKHSPAGVRNPGRFDMQFLPENEGVQILIRKTPVTEVFRLRTSQARGIRQFIKAHSDEILKEQETEFRESLKRFLQDWQTARENDLPFKTEAYLDPIGFNRLAGTTGYCLAAQVGSQTYRCVYEDAAGDLYFLLPQQTDAFALIGRKLPSGKTIFPGRYSVTVSNVEPQPETASPPPSEPEKPEEEFPMEPAPMESESMESEKAPNTEMRDEK